MNIGSNIYNAVKDNDSKKFAALLDANIPESRSFYVIKGIFEYDNTTQCAIASRYPKQQKN